MNEGKGAMTFANFIRAQRIRAQKSMGQMARELNISVVYYSEVEAGKKPPFPVAKFDYPALATALNTDLQELMRVAENDREKRQIVRLFDCQDDMADLAVAFGRRLSNKQLTEQQVLKIREILNEGE